MSDHYATLGVSKTASAEEIKSAWRRAAKAHHPDIARAKARKADLSETATAATIRVAERSFKDAQAAWAVLGDPGKRAAHDAWNEPPAPRPPRAGPRPARRPGQRAGFDYDPLWEQERRVRAARRAQEDAQAREHARRAQEGAADDLYQRVQRATIAACMTAFLEGRHPGWQTPVDSAGNIRRNGQTIYTRNPRRSGDDDWATFL